MAQDHGKNIISALIDKGLLDSAGAQKAQELAAQQNLPLEQALIKNKIIDEEEVVKTKAKLLDIAYVDLKEEFIPIKVLEYIPEEASAHYKFISFSADNGKIKVAMVDPQDAKAAEALEFFSLEQKRKIEPYICSEASFNFAFKQYHIITSEVKKALEDIESKTAPIKKESLDIEMGDMVEGKMVGEAPISKIVDMILRKAIEEKASDIHIEPTEEGLRIRNRIDGVLQSDSLLPERLHSPIISRIKILSNLKIDEQRKPQDGRFHTVIGGRSIDFRVSTLPTANGEKAALRILDKPSGIQQLEQLGIGPHYRKLLLEAIRKPYGTILVSGPTGSGKTTTIYALLTILNQEGVNIITLEDPIEYYISGVNQSQIRPEINYTFASGLRSILRQDPDIIAVGEIRDSETAELVTHAALTGHLVLSTIHTNNAIGVIPRLIDMGVEAFLISSSLNVTVAQRLVKRICENCKEEYAPTKEVESIVLKEMSKITPAIRKETGEIIERRPIKLYRGKGCKKCRGKGTKGRIGLFEMLEMTKELEQIIISSPTEFAIEKEARRQNMITLRQAGIVKALRGQCMIEEVLEITEREV